jgi:hypothetical protein
MTWPTGSGFKLQVGYVFTLELGPSNGPLCQTYTLWLRAATDHLRLFAIRYLQESVSQVILPSVSKFFRRRRTKCKAGHKQAVLYLAGWTGPISGVRTGLAMP